MSTASNDAVATFLILLFIAGIAGLWLVLVAGLRWWDAHCDRQVRRQAARDRAEAWASAIPPPVVYVTRPREPRLTAGDVLEGLLAEWLARRSAERPPTRQGPVVVRNLDGRCPRCGVSLDVHCCDYGR